MKKVGNLTMFLISVMMVFSCDLHHEESYSFDQSDPCEDVESGSMANYCYRVKLWDNRDSLFTLIMQGVNEDDMFKVKENLYKISYVLSELDGWEPSCRFLCLYGTAEQYNCKMDSIKNYIRELGVGNCKDSTTMYLVDFVTQYNN